jgi:hypothetical protein
VLASTRSDRDPQQCFTASVEGMARQLGADVGATCEALLDLARLAPSTR